MGKFTFNIMGLVSVWYIYIPEVVKNLSMVDVDFNGITTDNMLHLLEQRKIVGKID